MMALDEAIELASDTDSPAIDILQRFPEISALSDRERANLAVALLVCSSEPRALHGRAKLTQTE